LGHTYLRLKDSNAAVWVHNCATHEMPEGYDKQTNNLLHIIVRSAFVLVLLLLPVLIV